MANAGAAYEDFVTSVYQAITEARPNEVVEKDVSLPSPDGPVQIDILIRGQVAGHETLCVVECKDIKRPVDRPQIDKLDSIYRDVGAHMAIMVSRSGFTRSALTKARRKLIQTIQILNADDIKSRIDLKYPVIVSEYALGEQVLSYDVLAHREGLDFVIISTMIAEGLAHLRLVGSTEELATVFTRVALAAPDRSQLIPFIEGARIEVLDDAQRPLVSFRDVSFKARIQETFYYTHLHSFPPFSLSFDLGKGETQYVYRLEDIKEHTKNLQAAATEDQIPFDKSEAIHLEVVRITEQNIFRQFHQYFMAALTHPSSAPR